MDEHPPPPTDHVLRPHHVVLLTIIILVFKEPDSKTLPPDFCVHVYREILNEVSEVGLVVDIPFLRSSPPKVAQPKSYHELMQAVCKGPKSDTPEAQRLISGFKTVVS